MFLRSKRKGKANSGLIFFNDPKTSFFKEWFNDNHESIELNEISETGERYIFDLIIYLSTKVFSPEYLIPIPWGTKKSKRKNDVITFEFACWCLAQLQSWLIENKHPKTKKILLSFVTQLAIISEKAFEIRRDDIVGYIFRRLKHYDELKDPFWERKTLTELSAWGVCDLTLSFYPTPPRNDLSNDHYNKLSDAIEGCINVWSKYFHDTFDRTLLTKDLLLYRAELFLDPETSDFKEAFNVLHSVAVPENKSSYIQLVFEYMLQFAANHEYIKYYGEEIEFAERKKRNEITAFEIFCWCMFLFDKWLSEKNHPDKEEIFNTVLVKHCGLSKRIFSLEVEEIKNIIKARISHYHKLCDNEDIIESVSHQILMGFSYQTPSSSLAFEGEIKEDTEIVEVGETVKQWLSGDEKRFHGIWTDLLFVKFAKLKSVA